MRMIKHAKQLTLGEFIAKLKSCPQDVWVEFDFCSFVPDGCDSYRGYYEDLALGFRESDSEELTVAQLLEEMQEANGREFSGWKGGEFEMGDSTPLWVANRGDATGTAVTGVKSYHYKVVIKTRYVD